LTNSPGENTLASYKRPSYFGSSRLLLPHGGKLCFHSPLRRKRVATACHMSSKRRSDFGIALVLKPNTQIER
jgi:hypothetical protein